MLDIAIIGAGLAGLSTAKVLRQFGHRTTVFEQADDVGGVWSASRRYPGLTTQNPRTTYALSDFPMPADYPEWPSGAQVQAYMEAYVDRFELRGDLRLATTVVAAIPDDAGWTIRSRAGGAESEQRFDYLIVCNGIFSIPAVPDYPGAAEFVAAGGRILHTSQLTDLDLARDRQVIVVGYGKSSCDVAAATVGVASATTVLARNLIWKIPKKIGNLLNFKHLFLTRMGEGLFRYHKVRGFERFLHGPGRPLRNAMLGSVEGIVARQLKLRAHGLHPGKPLETIARSTVSLVTDEFYPHVAAGRLKLARDAIASLAPGTAKLASGATLPADLIVCGTGWHQRVPFFSPELTARITDAEGNFRLYRSMLPADVPRLAFNGYNSSFFSQLNAEVGAWWLADHLAGRIAVPPPAELDREIDARLAWMEERTDGKHSKGTNIIPFSVHHMDELLDDIDLRLPLTTRLKQWFVAINPSDYAPLLDRLLRRHSELAGGRHGAAGR